MVAYGIRLWRLLDVGLIQAPFSGQGGAVIALIAMRGATVEHREALRTELCRCIVAVVAESSTRDSQIWSTSGAYLRRHARE